MMFYFDPKNGGFYNLEVHGARKIFVIDPTWIQPTIEDNYGNNIPDLSIDPPKIEIPNPVCTLPPEEQLVAISEEEWKAALEAQSLGKTIIAGEDNKPTWPPGPFHSYRNGVWFYDSEKEALVKRAAVDAAVQTGMLQASNKIAVLQDAVDLEMATESEAAALTSWRKYRVLLSRSSSDPMYPDISLPDQPDAG